MKKNWCNSKKRFKAQGWTKKIINVSENCFMHTFSSIFALFQLSALFSLVMDICIINLHKSWTRKWPPMMEITHDTIRVPSFGNSNKLAHQTHTRFSWILIVHLDGENSIWGVLMKAEIWWILWNSDGKTHFARCDEPKHE